MKILGIETSCDETAAAVVQDGRLMLSNEIASSLDLHKIYGGVVPEIAARSHLESILPVIEQALKTAKCDWSDIDAIAVTRGPGLIGSLLIGVLTARTLALLKNIPLIGVNHVQAHPYAAFITAARPKGYYLPATEPALPFLALIASGGHTQLVLYQDHNRYKLLGQTTDDAVGEAYDKVAKILGLPYPGGPAITEVAKLGKPTIQLPVVNRDGYNFSFSGLKTATLRAAQKLAGKDFTLPSAELAQLLNTSQKRDLALAFQSRAIDSLINSLSRAERQYNPKHIVIAGGVAADEKLRRQADNTFGNKVIYADIKLCTDNAAMVASCAYFQTGQQRGDPLKMTVNPSLAM